MFNEPKEINKVYEKVDELFKIKIKPQLKSTGLIFEQVCHVTDLLTDEKSYTLTINRKVIGFNSTADLYTGLLKVIKSTELEIKEEIKYFEHHKNKDLNPDTVTIDYQLDNLYGKEYKLAKLSDRINLLLNQKTKV